MSREHLREIGGSRGDGSAAAVPPCCIADGRFCQEAWAAVVRQLGLSARQAEVAQYVVEDESDHRIARLLCLSDSTVQTHMERLHEKLDVHSRADLVKRVYAAYVTWRAQSPPPAGCQGDGQLISLGGSQWSGGAGDWEDYFI
jgi:DNA-binding CsgD family transcriptional regulator